MNSQMINKFINNNSKFLLYISLLLSISIHLVILYENLDARFIKVKAKKGGITFLNFSLNNNEMKFNSHNNRDGDSSLGKTLKNDRRISSFTRKIKKTGKGDERLNSLPTSISKDVLLNRDIYFKSILMRIHRMKYYPLFARKMKLQGVVKLKFTIRRNGKLKGNIIVLKGCKHEVLNQAGVKTIYSANPFPAFPEKLKGNEKTFIIDIDYKLDIDFYSNNL